MTDNKYIASVCSPDPRQGWYPCMVWCDTHLSNPWNYQSEGVFEFSSDSDRTLFLLRWS